MMASGDTAAPARCSAVLLVGGQSRRMGQPKALLPFRNRPLWEVQWEKLRAVADEVFLAPGHSGISFPASVATVTDHPGAHGPLAGILAGLRAAAHPLLLVLAVDLPGMTGEFLRTLVAESRPTCGMVPLLNGFFQGTAAVYPTTLRDMADELARNPDQSLQNFTRQMIARGALVAIPIDRADEGLFANWNQPDDLTA
jgi:molybdenum cofactor guanylyltransferase